MQQCISKSQQDQTSSHISLRKWKADAADETLLLTYALLAVVAGLEALEAVTAEAALYVDTAAVETHVGRSHALVDVPAVVPDSNLE